MKLRHLINAQDFDKAAYDEITRRALYFFDNGISPDLMRGKVAATLFFQPSTRTMTMFQTAAIRAGGGWVGVMGAAGLSMEKGESFEDTIREYGNFSGVIVLRHPDDDSAERAAKVSRVPVLNGGSGSREHAISPVIVLPYIQQYLKRPLEGLKIGIYGTPEINRVCKALVPVFGYYNIDLVVDDFGHFPLPKYVEEAAKKNGIKSITYDKLDNWIGDVDLLIVTRGLQKGIIPEDKFPKEKQDLIMKSYKPINTDHMKKLRKDAFLVMLKPRIFEVETAVDSDPRALYTKEEPYVESAAALMTYVLDVEVGS